MSRSRSSSRAPRHGSRHIRRATLALLVIGPLALGGTDPLLRAVFCVAALVLFAAHLLVKPPIRRWPGLTWAAIGVGVLTLVRAWPATGWLAATPVQEIWALWPDLGARATAAPGFAATAALRCAAIGALAAVCASRFSTVDRLGQLGRAVVAGAFIAALFGVAQHALEADGRLFLFPPRSIDGFPRPLAGPWVNPNQAGAYVALAGVICAGAAWIAPRQNQRFAGFAGAAAALTYAVAVDAWAAILAFLAAVASMLGAGVVSLVSRHPAALRPLAWSALVGCAGLALVAHAPNLVPTPEFVEVAARGKLSLWRGGAELIGIAPVAGWGAGSFADVVPRLGVGRVSIRYTWIESLPLQVAFDHGIPVLVAAALATIATPMQWIARRGRGAHAPWRGTAIAVGVFLMVEAIFGMGLHGLAQAFAATALVGSVSGLAMARHPRSRQPEGGDSGPVAPAPRVSPRTRTAIAVSAIVATAALALPGVPRGIALENAQHHRFDVGDLPTAAEILERAAATPGDPRVIGAAAYRALADDDLERAVQLAGYLAERAPRRVDTWTLAAAIAHTRNDERALCEATRRELEVRLSREAVAQLSGPTSTWLPCIPDAPAAREFVYTTLESQDRHSELMALAMRRLQLAPNDAHAAVAAGRSALALGMIEPAAWWAADARSLAPTEAGAWLLSARVERARNDELRALAMLDEGVAAAADTWHLRVERVRTLVRLAELGQAPPNWLDRALDDLEVLSAGSHLGEVSPRVHAELRARTELMRGEFDRAASAADSWLAVAPRDVFFLRLRLRAAVGGGDPPTIVRYAERLLDLVPDDTEARRALDALE